MYEDDSNHIFFTPQRRYEKSFWFYFKKWIILLVACLSTVLLCLIFIISAWFFLIIILSDYHFKNLFLNQLALSYGSMFLIYFTMLIFAPWFIYLEVCGLIGAYSENMKKFDRYEILCIMKIWFSFAMIMVFCFGPLIVNRYNYKFFEDSLTEIQIFSILSLILSVFWFLVVVSFRWELKMFV